MQKSKRRLFSSAESVLVRKDMNAIWNRKGIRALLMAMPVILVVIIPLIYFVAISLLPVSGKGEAPDTLLRLLSGDSANLDYRQFWMSIFTTLLCPVLFLCVPIICSVASASCAFVGEKEQGTLETLWLSSMRPRSVFNAKVTACTLISVIISLISFVMFTITVSVADIMLAAPFFFSLEWLMLAVLVMPALAWFSVVFVSLVLPRVFSVGETLQTIGYLVLPFILLYLLQFTGLFRVSPLFLLILAAVLFILSTVLFNVSARSFQAEKLLSASPER